MLSSTFHRQYGELVNAQAAYLAARDHGNLVALFEARRELDEARYRMAILRHHETAPRLV